MVTQLVHTTRIHNKNTFVLINIRNNYPFAKYTLCYIWYTAKLSYQIQMVAYLIKNVQCIYSHFCCSTIVKYMPLWL